MDIQNKIYSFLPIISHEKKILNNIIKNYPTYFRDYMLLYLNNKQINDLLHQWIIYNPEINIYLKSLYEDITINSLTLLQVQRFYRFVSPLFPNNFT